MPQLTSISPIMHLRLWGWEPIPDLVVYAPFQKIRSPAIWTYFIISQTTFHKIPTNNPLHAHAFSQIALSYSPFKIRGKPLHLATWYLSINLLQKWKTFLYERIIFFFFSMAPFVKIYTYITSTVAKMLYWKTQEYLSSLTSFCLKVSE